MKKHNLLDTAFATAGSRSLSPEPGPHCPSDGLLAGYVDEALTATEKRGVEEHALSCGDCHMLIKAVVDLSLPAPLATPRVSLVARVLQRGLELLNPLEVTVRSLMERADGEADLQPAAALGGLRRSEAGSSSESVAPEVIAIDGPGQGIDELQIRLQPDGQVRLQVCGNEPPPVHAGEIASVVLEVDGAPREKRPYNGSPMAFAPQNHGHYRIRLVARAPGEELRELSEAVIELRA